MRGPNGWEIRGLVEMRGEQEIPYFCFANQELYEAAYKDDPEVLLEGVAMAGPVGILRHLGYIC